MTLNSHVLKTSPSLIVFSKASKSELCLSARTEEVFLKMDGLSSAVPMGTCTELCVGSRDVSSRGHVVRVT